MHHIILNKNINDFASLIIDKDENKEDYNHLTNSLRIKIGEYVKVDILPEVFDLDAKELSYIGKIVDINEDNIEIVYEKQAKYNELPIIINLYQGLPKQDKLEFIIEKATELGVYSITPVSMRNCIKKMDESDTKKIDRLQKIARQAALQSMRHIIPEVLAPITYDEMIKCIAMEQKTNDIINENDANINNVKVYNVLCYEDVENVKKIDELVVDMKKYLYNTNPYDIVVNIIIGPEGGFDIKEIEKAKENNIELYSLGDRILRTETAPIVCLSQFINI